MKPVYNIVLMMAISLLISTTASAQLSYAEGGSAVEDPGLEVSLELRRYVDAVAGKDSNDGKTPASAWQSISKVNSAKATYTAGFHILFKRGQSWTDGSIDFANVNGSEGNRIVLGAYGLPLSAKANVQSSINANPGSYLMVREFDCVKINLDKGAHHIIVYDNIVHGQAGDFPSNGIRVWALTHHIAVVGNLVYDLRANDCIVVHGNGAGVGPGSGHWVLDNTVICNEGMEDGIDVALTDYERLGYAQEGDIKIVANRIQVKALAGLSTKTGRGSKCINSGHDGRYFWYVGNIMAGSSHIGFNLGGDLKKYTFISGNVAYDNAMVNKKVSFSFAQDHCYLDHNTIIHTVAYRAPLSVAGSGSYVLCNLLMRSENGTYIEGNPPAQGNATTISVPGISVPTDNAYNNDPRNWTDSGFIDHFIPDAGWSMNRGATTPGAFDSDQNWLGLIIKPFLKSGLANGGLGWEGPALVQQRLKELGISFGSTVSIDESKSNLLPNDFSIRNYPNPFNPSTTIRYNLPSSGKVKIQIFDLIGRSVSVLLNDRINAGSHDVVWNGKDSQGIQKASGVYFYRVQFNGHVKTAKIILMK